MYLYVRISCNVQLDASEFAKEQKEQKRNNVNCSNRVVCLGAKIILFQNAGSVFFLNRNTFLQLVLQQSLEILING